MNTTGYVTTLTCALQFALCLTVRAADYAIGADLSFLKQAEDRGTEFKDGGEVKPGLQIFKDQKDPARADALRAELRAWQQKVGAKLPTPNSSYDAAKPSGRFSARTPTNPAPAKENRKQRER